RIPCQHLDSLGRGALERLAEAIGRQRRYRDGVVTLIDEIVDELDLAADARYVWAIVFHRGPNFFAHRDGAFSARFEKANASQLGNERNLGAISRSCTAE